MVVYSVYIINKFGSLIFQNTYIETEKKLINSNYKIKLASTFYGLSCVSQEISPTLKQTTGIFSINTKHCRIYCLHAYTGCKFFVIASTNNGDQQLETFTKNVYEAYVNFVLKDPFYQTEQSIKQEKFVSRMKQIVLEVNKA